MWCKKVTKQFALITPQPQTTKMFRSLRSFKLSVLMSRSPQCRGLAFVYCSENATTSTTIYFHCSATNTSSLLYIQLKINMWLHFSLVMIISLALMLMTSVNELTTLHMPLAPLSFAQNNQKPPKYCRNKFLVRESGGSIQLTWFFLFTLIITFYYDRVPRFTCATAFDCLRWRRAWFLVWQFPLIFFARLQCEPTRPM